MVWLWPVVSFAFAALRAMSLTQTEGGKKNNRAIRLPAVDRLPTHSYLKAIFGSTLAALSAGKKHAASVTTHSRIETTAIVGISMLDTPYSRALKKTGKNRRYQESDRQARNSQPQSTASTPGEKYLPASPPWPCGYRFLAFAAGLCTQRRRKCQSSPAAGKAIRKRPQTFPRSARQCSRAACST